MNKERVCSAPGCAKLRSTKHGPLCADHERRWRTEGWRLMPGNAANAAEAARRKTERKPQAPRPQIIDLATGASVCALRPPGDSMVAGRPYPTLQAPPDPPTGQRWSSRDQCVPGEAKSGRSAHEHVNVRILWSSGDRRSRVAA